MKKSLTKILSVVSVLAMMPTLFAGCNSQKASSTTGASGPVQITWSTWGNPDQLTRFTDFTKKFNEKYKGKIEAKLVATPNDTYEQKLLAQLASGTAPDVFYINDTSITKFVSQNQLLDLTDMMNKSKTLKPDMIQENLYGGAKVNGKIYGVAPDSNPNLIYYNKNLIKEIGAKSPQEYLDEGKWNWEAFADICKKAAAAGKHGFVLGNSWAPLHTWLFGMTDNLYTKNGDKYSVDYTKPEVKNAFQFLLDLKSAKAIDYGASLPSGQGARPMFIAGQTALMADSRSGVPKIKDQIKNFEWDVVPNPISPAGKNTSAIYGSYVAINAKTKKADAAFTFLEEYNNAEGQTFRLANGGNALPSIKDQKVQDAMLADKVPAHGKYFFDARNNGVMFPTALQEKPDASTDFISVVDKIMIGKVGLDDGLKELNQKVNADFNK